MTTTCTSKRRQKKNTPMSTRTIILPEYRPDIGAPFEVVLHDAVRQRVCADSGEILETHVPNMGGLLKEVAVARTLFPRKFSADELKFLRKAVNLKGSELASLLGVSPEHLSRCENRDRVLSVAAEKLFRVIILKRRFNLSELEGWVNKHLSDNKLDEDSVRKLKEVMAEYRKCLDDVEKAVFDSNIPTVHDSAQALSFSFCLRSTDPAPANEKHSQEDEKWKQAA